MAAIGICCSGLVALAVAQGTPTLQLHQDLGGTGTYVHTATFLVSSEEALASYERHPWSQEGTASGLLLPPAQGSHRVGSGDRFVEFLLATYPMVSPTSAGVSTCAATDFVRLEGACGGPGVCTPGSCFPTWRLAHIGCPGSCLAGSGCARTANTVTSAVVTGNCVCGPRPAVCFPQGGFTIHSFTTSGPLCECVSPPPPCAPVGSGGGFLLGEIPLTCVTPPSIGTVFRLRNGVSPGFLSLGLCLPIPYPLAGCNPSYAWTIPLVLFPLVAGQDVMIPVPNDAQLIGASVCFQGVTPYPTGCLLLSEGIRATVQP
jgi:hypothetical protein